MATDVKKSVVAEVLSLLCKVIHDARQVSAEKESFCRLASFLEQLQTIVTQLEPLTTSELPNGIQTALKGIKSELHTFQDSLQLCNSKSRLYLLTHCRSLVNDIHLTTHSIGQWLMLVPHALPTQLRNLSKNVDYLAREMQQAQFMVSENEERICQALEREALITHPDKSDLAFQNAIIKDIGRALELDLVENKKPLLEHLQVLRKELSDCKHENELRLLDTINRLVQSCGVLELSPDLAELLPSTSSDSAAETDFIPPFEAFLCPLTKQVMKDPVVVESDIMYERSALEHWFETCREKGQDLSCPVSGQTLYSSEMRPSVVLRQTIAEWTQRNVVVRMRLAATHLGPASTVEDNEYALEEIIQITEENAANRSLLKDAGFIPLILGLWQGEANKGTQLRRKALKALHCVAIDNLENKNAMVELGVLKLAVKSLGSSLEKEKGSAVGLLHELSLHQHICTRLGSEKGAILFLVGITSNTDEDVGVASLAEDTLKNLEQVDVTVFQMAEAGRLQPLLSRLTEGSEEMRVKIAEHIGKMTLTNTNKEMVVQAGAQVLVQMLPRDVHSREASLGAIFNLSLLEETAPILIKAGVLGQLLQIMSSENNPAQQKELAASILAHLVSVQGSWERSRVNQKGDTLQSEVILKKLLALLTRDETTWKDKLLQALHGIASSPAVSEAVARHMRGEGINTMVKFLQDKGARQYRLYVLQLLSVLSMHIGPDVAGAFRSEHQLAVLKELLMESDKVPLREQTLAATILANLPLTEFEAINVLEVSLLPWTLTMLTDAKNGKLGKLTGRAGSTLQEGLLGILLHFARSSNATILDSMREHNLLTVFQDHLTFLCSPLVKERAAFGLEHLSEKAHLFTTKIPEPATGGFCCMSMLQKPPQLPQVCPVHGGTCDANKTFCLVSAKALVPLLEHLEPEQPHGVKLSSISALSTLLSDKVRIKGGVEELFKVDGLQPIFSLLYTVRQGPLQEKAVWIIERILRVEEYAQGYAVDQALFNALVEAFKHGSPGTRGLAQDALTHLKQLSGVSTGPRGKSRMRHN